MISTSLHLLSLERGLVSIIFTVSPSPHSLFSSCALSLMVLLMTLPYFGCFTLSSIATTMVLSILSLTTLPTLVFLRFLSIASLMTYTPLYDLFSSLFVEGCHNSCDVLFNICDLMGIVKLIDLILEAEFEKLAFQLFKLRGELSGSHFVKFSSFHCLCLLCFFFFHEFTLDRELVRCETHSFLCNVLSNAVHFEHNSAGLNDCNPVFGRTYQSWG